MAKSAVRSKVTGRLEMCHYFLERIAEMTLQINEGYQ